MNPDAFLVGAEQVCSLPNARTPKLHICSQGVMQRWRHSQLYPAYRTRAKLYRLMVRVKAAVGLIGTRPRTRSDSEIREFLKECLPSVSNSVVHVGTPGPAQKSTVELWRGQQVVGYLKYGVSDQAKHRIENERAILSVLPRGLGPTVLKFGEFLDGLGLVVSPVRGQAVQAGVPLRHDVLALLRRMDQPESWSLGRHPWIQAMQSEYGSTLDTWFGRLSDRSWPVTYQHGDFAPWNVLRTSSHGVVAIDWEYGNPSGFPYLDEANFYLQLGALVKRWPPRRTRSEARLRLCRDLTAQEADSVISLAAFTAFQEAIRDGHGRDTPLQRWRRRVWEAERWD